MHADVAGCSASITILGFNTNDISLGTKRNNSAISGDWIFSDRPTRFVPGVCPKSARACREIPASGFGDQKKRSHFGACRQIPGSAGTRKAAANQTGHKPHSSHSPEPSTAAVCSSTAAVYCLGQKFSESVLFKARPPVNNNRNVDAQGVHAHHEGFVV